MGARVSFGAGLGILAAVSVNCAVTTTTCPTGTKLVVDQKPDGRSQWCAVAEPPLAQEPVVGRSFGDALGLGRPPAMAGGADGPFTSWYPDGAIASHGRYVNDGARSLPEGLWAFWHANGQRWTVGIYHRGEPIGCFAEWDEHGTASTGTVVGDTLHPESCTPPPMDELAILEGRAPAPIETPAWADVSLSGFAGPTHLGASSSDQIDPRAAATLAFSATARMRFGRLRIGPAIGIHVPDSGDAMALYAGAQIAWELPSFHPRIDTELSADLAAQYITLTAERTMQPGVASLSFWSPLPALQGTMAIELTPDLSALIGVRLDGVPARNEDLEVTYCNPVCFAPVHEAWQVGGFGLSGSLGLRLSIR